MRAYWFVAFLVALSFPVPLLLAGCGGPAEPTAGKSSEPTGTQMPAKAGPVKVAFVTNNASDFWTIAKRGTEKAATELGCQVIFRIPSAGTAQEQQGIVQDLITSGVSGIAISPKDPANQTEMLNEAAAKVDLITQDSDAPNSSRACYIGTNNYEAGKAAGELIKKTLPNGGKIMLFVGTLDAQNAQDRKKGIEDALAGSNVAILGTRTDETDRAKSIANVQDTLVAFADVACLVGLWSYNGPAILNGVRDSARLDRVKIVCFDEEEETLQGVRDGHISGTIVQQPFEFGYQSVKLLTELAKKNRSVIPDGKQIFIPVKTITREDVEAFWTELNKMRGQS